MHHFLKSARVLIVLGLCAVLFGCATTGQPKSGPDDLNQWLQNEMSRRGVLSGSTATATLRGV
ncbi:hypothetical protein OIV19_18310 [Brucella sp. HL-2]|nr:hypothetical protein [Brucella sp. HL-2]MCV9909557.1 hypothetical protein [Brucella sp. HL-2]